MNTRARSGVACTQMLDASIRFGVATKQVHDKNGYMLIVFTGCVLLGSNFPQVSLQPEEVGICNSIKPSAGQLRLNVRPDGNWDECPPLPDPMKRRGCERMSHKSVAELLKEWQSISFDIIDPTLYRCCNTLLGLLVAIASLIYRPNLNCIGVVSEIIKASA